jgi:hypothetical protein
LFFAVGNLTRTLIFFFLVSLLAGLFDIDADKVVISREHVSVVITSASSVTATLIGNELISLIPRLFSYPLSPSLSLSLLFSLALLSPLRKESLLGRYQ